MSDTASSYQAGLQQAHTLFTQGRKSEAVAQLQEVAKFADTAFNLRKLALHFNEMNKPHMALELLIKAVNIDPNDAELLNSLALTYWALGEYEKAEFVSRQSIKHAPMNPLFHANLSLALLHQGRYPDAWPHFRQRHMVIPYRREWAFAHRTWRGETLTSESLLLYCSQGIGDIFLLSRYFPLIRERVAHIILEVDETCLTLYKNCPWVDEVRIRDDRKPPQCDVHCELFDLPMVFNTSIHSIPPCQPLPFKPDLQVELSLAGYRKVKPGWKHVGLVWSGHIAHIVNPRRSCGLRTMLPLLELGSIQFYSIQKGEAQVQMNQFSDATRCMIDLSPALIDFRATATAIEKLDLVITVDTSVANLAGMMGKEVWVLLHDNPEWRWGRSGNSPWYPNVRVFRQSGFGDWEDVIRRVRAELIASLLDF